MEAIPDLARYPELRWLDRYWLGARLALAVALLLAGRRLVRRWCGASSYRTTLLYHGTFTINSLAHLFGSRRYPTTTTAATTRARP